MSRETDYKPRTIDEQIDAVDNSIVIWHTDTPIEIVADLAHT